VRNGPSGGHIRLPTLDHLKDIQVVQDVLDAAIVWQTIEERSDGFLDLHAASSSMMSRPGCRDPDVETRHGWTS
jgi:hypothetical protein